jgi:transcription-repair coupling factor (superfamily II helicase)
MIRNIERYIKEQREYKELLSMLQEKRHKPLPLLVTGLSEGARSLLIASLCNDRLQKNSPLLLILPSEKEVARQSGVLTDWGLRCKSYTLRDFTFRNISASHEYEHERLSVLYSVLNQTCDVVLTTPDAAVQYTMPQDILTARIRRVQMCEPCDLMELCNFLAECGYTGVEMVEAYGQYSRRGDILDIFPPHLEHPVRLEFFGDEIDRMSYFDVRSQRRTDDLEELTVTPVREVIPSAAQKAELREIILKEAKKKGKSDAARKALMEEAETLAGDRELSCIDKYISWLYPQKECLIDYFDSDALVISQDYSALNDRLRSYALTENDSTVSLLEAGLLIPDYAEHSRTVTWFDDWMRSRNTVIINSFTVSMSGMELAGIYTFQSNQTSGFADQLALLIDEIADYQAKGFRLAIFCEGNQSAKNLQSMLAEKDIQTSLNDPRAMVQIIVAPSIPGFELRTAKFAALSVCKGGIGVSGKQKTGNKSGSSKKTAAEKIMAYTDLVEGDLVVHTSHGIGQYLGLESLMVAGIRRDFVKIRYAGDDMLYLPCNQLDMLSKYIGSGGDNSAVHLSRMGGAEWGKAKAKAKAATKEMAKELIQLYAARLRKKGFAFAPDDALTREFADTFEYDETEGQLAAIREITKDMEADHPMDRLLCGDVGYGKTEVALRAAFKAVMSGKQVAILVPTTILALQHYQTLLSRMRGFAINVDMLSRFRNSKQQALSLRKLERGETDIIVGTHRMLSKDIKFRDLGLVIIDEEQRFGVGQKEKLKQLTENVDVLTLTATPIPRTLNMAMSGIRDMSVLEEAPGERQPVQTYVTEYDRGLIAEAIRKELRRGGQVFYLCNSIERLPYIAQRLKADLPDARIAVANGQMDKEDLSDIWHSMIVGETDILICTTIIETGVDVPNANTLIIENADAMGLSQLHQLRGRVGRSSRRAYAYFTFPQNKVLTEVSSKRLDAIRDFTEFGAGFKIAMRDLEIRGAGNILGAEQHGHMSGVGYDLYMRLLNEAILEEKGEMVQKTVECTINAGIDAYIPEKYVRSSNHRMEAYKKISLIRSQADLYDITDELLDRYGDPPKPVTNLLKISLMRALGSQAGITKIELKGNAVMFYPEQFDLPTWIALSKKNFAVQVIPGKTPCISMKVEKASSLEMTNEALKTYLKIQETKTQT